MTLQIRHPLFDQLRELDREIARRLPREHDPGLGGVGLILTPKLQNGGYRCTPSNSRAFAHTGGEGVHFSFLGEPDEIDETSAIIVTIPGVFDHPNFIVGESLFEFLCFGMYRGFFAIEQLGYRFEEAFRAYTDPNWQPSEDRHHWVGYGVDDRKRAILNLLIEKLQLAPWQQPLKKFHRLQEEYLGRLIIPPETDCI
jgi:hypothetical protein